MKSAQVEADSSRPVLAFLPDPEDEGHDVRRRGEGMVLGARAAVAESVNSMSSVASQPDVKLPPGDSEEPTSGAHVSRHLLAVLNAAETKPRLAILLDLPRCLSHFVPPSVRSRDSTPTVQGKGY